MKSVSQFPASLAVKEMKLAQVENHACLCWMTEESDSDGTAAAIMQF